MKIKEAIILVILSLILGWILIHARPIISDPMALGEFAILDTIKPLKPKDTIIDVNGKRALFIGDSHTSYEYGWQYQVCKKTGMAINNTAVGGKQTSWMIGVAKLNLTSGYDYCFIYGGANDMAGNRAPIKSVKNVQAIVDMCLEKQVTPIVITGFDPLTCINVGGREAYRMYPQRYAKFQQLLIDSIVGAKVIKSHCILKSDCGDFLCHMTASGHKKMAEFVISACRFKKI